MPTLRAGTDHLMTRQPRTLWKVLFWPCLLLFVLSALFGMVHWYLQLDLQGFSLEIFDARYLCLAVLFHGIALALSIGSWHLNLHKHGLHHLPFLQSLAMTGLSTLGKYTPGKVWGILARGAAVQKIAGKTQTAATSALTEQIALLHSGAAVALLCLMAGSGWGWPAIAGSALIAAATAFWLAHSGTPVWHLLRRIDRKGRLHGINPDRDFKAAYPWVFSGLCAMWVAASLVLWAGVRAYGMPAPPDLAEVTLITLLAYFAGFAGFFAPAGLGIRDGIMVAMLTPHTGVGPALYISLLHRLITAGFDLVLGSLSLFLVDKNPLESKD
jgi:hypothetical protein